MIKVLCSHINSKITQYTNDAKGCRVLVCFFLSFQQTNMEEEKICLILSSRTIPIVFFSLFSPKKRSDTKIKSQNK